MENPIIKPVLKKGDLWWICIGCFKEGRKPLTSIMYQDKQDALKHATEIHDMPVVRKRSTFQVGGNGRHIEILNFKLGL